MAKSLPVSGPLRGMRPKVRRRLRQSFEGKVSLTKQSFKDECDVNNIVNKFKQTGVITHVREGVPQYGDFSMITDFHSAHEAVQAASAAFMQLDAGVRSHFSNDAGRFLAALDDPSQKDVLVKLGVLKADLPLPADAPAGDPVKS